MNKRSAPYSIGLTVYSFFIQPWPWRAIWSLYSCQSTQAHSAATVGAVGVQILNCTYMRILCLLFIFMLV